jgi:RNA-directed DNA polymerase
MIAGVIMTTEPRRYPRDQSPLWKITSPAMLATRLEISPRQLQRLEAKTKKFRVWNDTKTGRQIEQPEPKLENIHKRVGMLLSRIETPDYLHSAIKGRSYISNASSHSADQPSVKSDIKKFYPSIRAQAVFTFFHERMQCARDVAGKLTELLTYDRHLPTGSSASPILSYFAYEDMFEEINAVAVQRGCLMTCYVDDMVFTGPGATNALLYDIRRVIGRYRLKAHKTRTFQANQPKIITGVAVTQYGLKLPNKRKKLIADSFIALKVCTTDDSRIAVLNILTSRLHEAAQIDQSWKAKADEMSALLKHTKRDALAALKP